MARRSISARGALWLAALALALAACSAESDAFDLSRRAKNQWESGATEDAARNFITLTELYPGSVLAEESYYWAASLYRHYLGNRPLAVRNYQQGLLRFPDGPFALEARENLAQLYAEEPATIHRALQLYRQLMAAKELRGRQEEFQLQIALLNLQMGRTDQARFEFRSFLRQFERSEQRPQVFYLIGYSYYLDNRRALALAVMAQTARDFQGSPVAGQAQFFMADTQEESGHFQDALRLFQGLDGKYHNPKILEKRIETLQARIRRGVR
jgi:tetratricopeptide (TPR) repeat protein